jgi:hypothetical protein
MKGGEGKGGEGRGKGWEGPSFFWARGPTRGIIRPWEQHELDIIFLHKHAVRMVGYLSVRKIRFRDFFKHIRAGRKPHPDSNWTTNCRMGLHVQSKIVDLVQLMEKEPKDFGLTCGHWPSLRKR